MILYPKSVWREKDYKEFRVPIYIRQVAKLEADYLSLF